MAKGFSKGTPDSIPDLSFEFTLNPEDRLYIYELSGTVVQPESFFQNSLIAHWREGDSTFLFFSSPAEAELQAFLTDHPGLSWVRTHEISYRDWQAGENLEPLSVGRLRIFPLGHPVVGGRGLGFPDHRPRGGLRVRAAPHHPGLPQGPALGFRPGNA